MPQVMEEGEQLSKKQMLLEGTVKKLRVAAKEASAQKSAVDEALAREQAGAATTRLQLEQANTALQVRLQWCFISSRHQGTSFPPLPNTGSLTALHASGNSFQ